MSRYLHNLNNLIIRKESSEKIFKFNQGECIGLNKESYQNEICKLFLNQFERTVFIQWGRARSNSVIIDLYCASRKCPRKFKIKQLIAEISEKDDIIFSVKSTLDQCNHTEKVIRPLKGNERKEVASKAKLTSVSSVRSEAKIQANKDSLQKGNMQQIYSTGVLRKAISEKSSENDRHSNPIFDLILQCDELDIVHNVECKSDRFAVTVISEKNMEILHAYIAKCQELKEISRVYYDATGGILESPKENIRSIFNHVMVFPWKFHDLDNNSTAINIGELITSLHTSNQQEIFLRRLIQNAMKNRESKKGKKF
jgi:hypothetical protein